MFLLLSLLACNTVYPRRCRDVETNIHPVVETLFGSPTFSLPPQRTAIKTRCLHCGLVGLVVALIVSRHVPVVCRCLRLCVSMCELSAQVPSCGGVDSVNVGGDHLVTEIEALVRQKMVRHAGYFFFVYSFQSLQIDTFSLTFGFQCLLSRIVPCFSPLFVSVASRFAWPINFWKSPFLQYRFQELTTSAPSLFPPSEWKVFD